MKSIIANLIGLACIALALTAALIAFYYVSYFAAYIAHEFVIPESLQPFKMMLLSDFETPSIHKYFEIIGNGFGITFVLAVMGVCLVMASAFLLGLSNSIGTDIMNKFSKSESGQN